MACGLRRCSGRRGCMCPKSRTSGLALTGSVLASPPAIQSSLGAGKLDGCVEAAPEDVVKLFQFFDVDGNGKLDRNELASVLSDLDCTYWTLKRIRALFRAADLDRDQFISWQEFCKWIFAAGEEQRVIREAVPVLDTKRAENKMAVEAEKVARLELRSNHEALLVEADTVAALASALEAAEPCFEVEELQKHRHRLETMKSPFRIVLMTLAGGDFAFDVTREQSVISVCQELAKLVDKKAYRVVLAHEGGRLGPPTATLEQCGVKGPMQLAVQFNEADPLLELPLPDFLALAREHDLATESQIREILQGYNDAKISDEEVHSKFKIRLTCAIRRAEEKRKIEEAEKAEQEERQRKVLEERRTGLLAKHRAQFEPLPSDALVEQAVNARILPKGKAVPEDDHDHLIGQLTLVAVTEACDVEAVVLMDACRDAEVECSMLAKEIEESRILDHGAMYECSPHLEACLKAFDGMDLFGGTKELRKHKCVPSQLLATMTCVCKLLGIKPNKFSDPNCPGEWSDDYWHASVQFLLTDPMKFMNDLLKFDKDNIPHWIIDELTPYIEDEACTPEAVKSCFGEESDCAIGEALCLWVRAMYYYHFALREVLRKQSSLRKKEDELETASSKLALRRQELQQNDEDLQYFRQKVGAVQHDFE